MAFHIVTMTHPDGPGWSEQVKPHVDYLRKLVEEGHLKASGPLKGESKRKGFLIFQTESRAQVDALVAADPFAIHDLIEELEVHEWDPLFGTFASEASGDLPGLGRV